MEGQNIVIEYRYAEGKFDRLAALAAELVRLKVDIIVTTGPTEPVRLRKRRLQFPLLWRLIRSCWQWVRRQPCAAGGNITGLSTLAPELSGKQLELLKEILPRLSRVAVFGTSSNPGNAQMLKEVRLAAGAFGVKVQYLEVRGPKDIETAFRAGSKERAEAVLYLWRGRRRWSPNRDYRVRVKEPAPGDIPEPAICRRRRAHVLRRESRRLGPARRYYVDKILKGASPPICRSSSRRSSSW